MTLIGTTPLDAEFDNAGRATLLPSSRRDAAIIGRDSNCFRPVLNVPPRERSLSADFQYPGTSTLRTWTSLEPRSLETAPLPFPSTGAFESRTLPLDVVAGSVFLLMVYL